MRSGAILVTACIRRYAAADAVLRGSGKPCGKTADCLVTFLACVHLPLVRRGWARQKAYYGGGACPPKKP